MTVRELIDRLNRLPPDLPVFLADSTWFELDHVEVMTLHEYAPSPQHFGYFSGSVEESERRRIVRTFPAAILE